MFNYSKDGVVVSTVLGARTINKEGKYPVKIKVYYQKKPKYYSIGICMTKEEWNKLPDSKSFENRKIKQAIESSFSLVRMNVEALVGKGTFSFNTLNLRLGKATGDTLNSAIRAKIEELKSEDRIGTMQFFKCTLVMVEEVGGKDIPFSAITVEWLQKCEKLWSKTKSVSTIGMHMRNIRTLMNEAKRAGVSKESQYPFGKGLFEIKTGIGRKKGLTKKLLKVISDYKSGNKMTNRYKDFWIFIYEQEASVSEPITQEEAAENTPEKREYTIDELIDMLGPDIECENEAEAEDTSSSEKEDNGEDIFAALDDWTEDDDEEEFSDEIIDMFDKTLEEKGLGDAYFERLERNIKEHEEAQKERELYIDEVKWILLIITTIGLLLAISLRICLMRKVGLYSIRLVVFIPIMTMMKLTVNIPL